MSEPTPNPRRLAETSRRLARAFAADEPLPPTQAAEERVWRAMRSAPSRSLVRWLWAVPGLAAAAAVALWLVPARSGGELVRLSLLAGEVTVARPGAARSPARLGEALPEQATVRTASGGKAYLRFADAGALLGASSAASVSGDGKAGFDIALHSGEVSVAARKRRAERALTVTARGYTVRVVGTVFQVRSHDDGIEVRVHEGVVEVTGPGLRAPQRVSASQSWSSRRGAGALAMPKAEAALAQALRDAADREVKHEVRVPHGQAVKLDGVPVGRDEVQLLASVDARLELESAAEQAEQLAAAEQDAALEQAAGEPAVVTALQAERASDDLATGTQAAATERPAKAAPAAERSDANPKVASQQGERAASAERGGASRERAVAEPPAALWREAQKLLAKRQSAAAEKKLAALSQGRSPRAELALYELGRVRLRELHDPRGAQDAFREYRRRFPDGSLGPDVHLSLIEALLASRSFSEAAGEADAFLRLWPGSERLDDVRLLRGNIHREWGDCRAALADYQPLLAEGHAHADDALYFSAICDKREGEKARWSSRMNEYLRRFPDGRRRAEVQRALEEEKR